MPKSLRTQRARDANHSCVATAIVLSVRGEMACFFLSSPRAWQILALRVITVCIQDGPKNKTNMPHCQYKWIRFL